MIRVKNALYSCVLLIGAVLAVYGTKSVNFRHTSRHRGDVEAPGELFYAQHATGGGGSGATF